MAIELPHFELPRFNTGSLTRDVELPHVEAPKIDLPKVELPKVELPKVDLQAIGKRMDGVGRDLRSLRLVREPSATEARARAASTAGIWLLGGLGIGLALMYFFDPRVGRARRQRLAARIGDLTGVAQRAITGPSRGSPDEGGDVDLEPETWTSPSTVASSTRTEPELGSEADTTMEPRIPELAATQRS